MLEIEPEAIPYYAAAHEEIVPRATFFDTLAVLFDVLLPTIAKGVIIRRPAVMTVAEWLQVDRRAIRRMQAIRDSYGPGPLLLRIPGRRVALIVDPEHVHRVLRESPHPFATATKEKRAALAHFEPKNVLLSTGLARTDRRLFNEEVLESDRPVHSLAERFVSIVDVEGERLCRKAREQGELNWDVFSEAWFRVVRRVVFGDGASDDNELSIVMAKLRRRANWAFVVPQSPRLRRRLLERIEGHLRRAQPDSLAGVIARVHQTEETAAAHQVPQWLFAFDPAGMTVFRSLALLTSFRDYARAVRQEIETGVMPLTFTRAAVLESLRLWPTSPLILRETTEITHWNTGILPANTGLVIFAPLFHRDSERLNYADRFKPELWIGENRAHDSWPIIPFSEGPATCPGRNLVLLLTSSMIAAILKNARVRLKPQRVLDPALPLPATLNHFALRFELAPRI